jgi:hypothetical protein
MPPAIGPPLGLSEAIVGGENLNLLASDGALVPAGVVTLTLTLPALDSGVTASISNGETTVKLRAGSVPNATAVANLNSAPLMTTDVSPVGAPFAGVTFEIVGAAACPR